MQWSVFIRAPCLPKHKQKHQNTNKNNSDPIHNIHLQIPYLSRSTPPLSRSLSITPSLHPSLPPSLLPLLPLPIPVCFRLCVIPPPLFSSRRRTPTTNRVNAAQKEHMNLNNGPQSRGLSLAGGAGGGQATPWAEREGRNLPWAEPHGFSSLRHALLFAHWERAVSFVKQTDRYSTESPLLA